MQDYRPYIDNWRPGIDNVLLTKLDWMLRLGQTTASGRYRSAWPAADEMMASAAPKFDQARFRYGSLPATPRQADLMIIAGRLSWKMAPVSRIVGDDAAPEVGAQHGRLPPSCGGVSRPTASCMCGHDPPGGYLRSGLPTAPGGRSRRA